MMMIQPPPLPQQQCYINIMVVHINHDIHTSCTVKPLNRAVERDWEEI